GAAPPCGRPTTVGSGSSSDFSVTIFRPASPAPPTPIRPNIIFPAVVGMKPAGGRLVSATDLPRQAAVRLSTWVVRVLTQPMVNALIAATTATPYRTCFI